MLMLSTINKPIDEGDIVNGCGEIASVVRYYGDMQELLPITIIIATNRMTTMIISQDKNRYLVTRPIVNQGGRCSVGHQAVLDKCDIGQENDNQAALDRSATGQENRNTIGKENHLLR